VTWRVAALSCPERRRKRRLPTKGRREAKDDSRPLLKKLKQVLRERVGEVRASDRLTESASCLVLGEQDLGHGMRELLKAAGHAAPDSVPDLEINLDHDLIRRLDQESR
jgi:molecular chaperone HtpG